MKNQQNEFTLDGIEYEAVESDYNSCIDCAFSKVTKLCEKSPHCTPDKRSDGLSVIFKVKGSSSNKQRTLTYKELEAKYKEAQSLLDACYEVVELWDCQAPSQIEWKREWLEKARLHGASGV